MLPDSIKNKYILEREYKSGGQSRTFLVSNVEGLYILKVPVSNNLSKERKFRLKREVEALKLLDGQGVPKLVDADIDNDVFMIMEYIKGKTLAEYVGGTPLSFNKAIEIFKKLIGIIHRAHTIGLYHRDIKPDNIIIREEDEEPVVIDFGICWLQNDEDDFKTKTSIELGNRFLRLPELSKGSNVTISTSDVTFLVGILFFMLSGEAPNILLNENGELPHQRHNLIIDKLLNRHRALSYIFDKGFAYDISLRYQTTAELNEAMDNLNNNHNDIDYDIKEELRALMNDSFFQKQKERVDFIINLHHEFLNSFQRSLIPGLVTGGNGPNFYEDRSIVETQMYLVRTNTIAPQIWFHLFTKISGNNQLITSYGTNSIKRDVEHSLSEISKLEDDYRHFGAFCAVRTMKELKTELLNLKS